MISKYLHTLRRWFVFATEGDLEYVNPRLEYEGAVDSRKALGCNSEIWGRRDLHHCPVCRKEISRPLKWGDTRALHPIALYGPCRGEEAKEPVFEDDTGRLTSLAGLTENIEELHLDDVALALECLP